MQRRVLSSGWTVFYKFLGIPTVVLMAGYGVWVFYTPHWRNVPGEFYFILLLALAANFAFSVWVTMRVMHVEVDEHNFYVSNYSREIVIPRSDLYEATEMRWMQPYWITLHLRRPSEFGDRIVFIPPWRLGAFWTANPLIEELNQTTSIW